MDLVCKFYYAPERRGRISAFSIAFRQAPEQYLLAARHAIDHFSILAPPEKQAIIDWSHCMLNRAVRYQSLKEHLFCEWAEFAWQLYLHSPNDFPILPIQSLEVVTRFNFDQTGVAQRTCQRLFRVQSINRVRLKNVCDTLEAGDFPLLYESEKLPPVPVTEMYWTHSSQGRPDIARLIRGEPCFSKSSTFYRETDTLILSAQFLIDRALSTLRQTTSKLTGARFLEELTDGYKYLNDFTGHAELNRQLIRLISDKRSAAIYTPVICKELARFRVLIVGNFSDQLTIFESPAGQNFNLTGSGIFSEGISLDSPQSLEKIKRLINEHDATIVSSE